MTTDTVRTMSAEPITASIRADDEWVLVEWGAIPREEAHRAYYLNLGPGLWQFGVKYVADEDPVGFVFHFGDGPRFNLPPAELDGRIALVIARDLVPDLEPGPWTATVTDAAGHEFTVATGVLDA